MAELIIRPDAELDILDIHQELDTARPGWGGKFKSNLTTLLNRIESNPRLYPLIWEDVRAVRVRKFQYVVYYILFPEQIEVIAVTHGARSDTVWQSRLI